MDAKILNSGVLKSQSHQSRPTELRGLDSRPLTVVIYAPLPAGKVGKLTREETEAGTGRAGNNWRTQIRGREEHVNWEQENKEEDSGAIGTDQVWWNSHEERQSLAWVTPAGPKVMRKEREKERHRDGQKEERYKTLARAFVKSWEHWEGLCFICGLLLSDWLMLCYILSLLATFFLH